MSIKQVVSLLQETYTKWSDHQAPRLGASVAFYSILSFAPLLVLVTAVIALVFGHESAQGALIGEARQLLGDRVAETAETLLQNAQKPTSGIFASVVAFLTLLFGASGVFTELQDALNTMWDVPARSSSGFMGMVKQKLFSFGMVLSVGFLLLVSLLLSAGLALLGKWFGQLLPLPAAVLQGGNFVASFAVIAILFALMFRYVPATKVPWRDVGIGAIGTALLFTVGKFALGVYLGKASVGSTYGAAGSLVAVVVWIYYSAQIFFFGAEFTHVYAEAQLPARNAESKNDSVRVPETEAAVPSTTKADPLALPMAATVSSGRPVHFASASTPAVNTFDAAAVRSSGERHPTLLKQAQAPPKAVIAGLRRTEAGRTPPKLLMSAILGFALGRLSGKLGRN